MDTMQPTATTPGADQKGPFWTSLPGVLTGLAALATAILGPMVALHGFGGGGHSPAPPANPSAQAAPAQQLGNPASSAPATVQSVDPSSVRVGQISDRDRHDAGVLGILNDCANGDPNACGQILDSFATDCDRAAFDKCDTLYELSPVGSDWEAFGATCGGRLDTDLYAGECAQLAGQS